MKQSTLTNMQIADLCLQLALLLQAGVRLSDGLFMLAEEEENTAHQTMLSDMATKVDAGAFLA